MIRGKAAGLAIDAAFGLRTSLTRSVISVVTVGEMSALALMLGWGPKKVGDLERPLEQIVWIDINHPDVLAAYAELDAWSDQAGRSMGKNDVWIAVTGRVVGATLLTTDSDFDHLHDSQITRIRIDQQTGAVIP